MVRHTSTIVAVPSKADTQLSPMGVAWSTNALVACSLRMGSQDSRPSHGPIVLRCPGSGRFPPMSTPLISVSFPNLFRCSRSRPIECELWKRSPPKKCGWSTRGGGLAPTVGAADGDCRSGCRLPRVWVDRQPSLDRARAAVQSAQQSEVHDSDSWPVQANTSSASQI
jgi:hypothetical protein